VSVETLQALDVLCGMEKRRLCDETDVVASISAAIRGN